jgi:iron complex outermembrane recepter protein
VRINPPSCGRRQAAIVGRVSALMIAAIVNDMRAQPVTPQGGGDAFGLRIGQESIGLYSESLVRGFNLQEAGNYRIGDAYFVRAANPSDAVVEGVRIRVGPSALDLDFPAPSGLVEYRLLPADQERSKLELGFQHLGDQGGWPYLRAHIARRAADGNASLAAGLIGAPGARYMFGNEAHHYYGAGLVPRLRLHDRWEITGVLSRYAQRYQADVGFTPAGGESLPQPDRLKYLGQPWSRYDTRNTTYGVIASTIPRADAWDHRVSSLFSGVDRPRSDYNLFDAVTSDGIADASTVVAVGRTIESWGHELSSSRDWTGEHQRHELTLLARLRRSAYRNPHVAVVNVGRVSILDGVDPVAEPPAPDLAARSRSRIDQSELGVGWNYADRGGLAFNVGLRRADLEQATRVHAGAAQARESAAWLHHANLVAPLGPRLTAFAATTRGIEEGRIAPENSANRFEVLAPVLARQQELGLKWQAQTQLALLAMAFEIEKPSAGIDRSSRYRYLTDVTHRGIELSAAGQVTEHLDVIAGLTVMRPRLRGELVDDGSIGERPIGRAARQAVLGMTVRMPHDAGLSFDADASYTGAQPVQPLTGVELPAYTVLNVGARYRFEVAGTPAAIRLRIHNATDRYAWSVGMSGIQTYEPERRIMLNFTLGE